MQVGKRRTIIEPGDLRHYALEQTEDAVGFRVKRLQLTPPVDPPLFAATVVKQVVNALRTLGRRQIGEGQIAFALEMRAFRLEHCAPLAVDEERDRVRKAAFRIAGRLAAQRFNKQCPARAQALQRVVEPGTDGDELGIGRAVEIGAAVPARALQ